MLSQMHTDRHVKYLLLQSDFNETWICSTDIRKKTRGQISWQSDIHISVHHKYISEQDVTFLDVFIYFYRCSTCFMQFLRPSSGAHNCTCSFRCCQPVLLLAAIADEMELHLINDSSKQQYWLTLPETVCTVACSWWWAEEPPETYTASVEINKSRTVASCWM